MIYHQFPDLQWLRNQAEQQFSNRKAWDGSLLPSKGWPTVIMNTTAQNVYRDRIPGPLSMFLNLSGSSVIHHGAKRQRVGEGFFYVTNAGERYTLEVGEKPAETFNIHFGEHFAQSVLSALTCPDDQLLEFEGEQFQLEITSRLIPQTDHFKNQVRTLQTSEHLSNLIQEELTAEILKSIITEEKHLRKKVESIDGLKPGTRKEISRRVINAVDFIYENYQTDISLDELASAACLSKFHLLRQFKNIHKKTPHQFVNDVRIERAKTLLLKTKRDVKSVARETGFKDSSSFSRLFVKKTGLYPTAFRENT